MADARSIPEHGRVRDRAFLFSSLQKPGTILLESSRQETGNTRNFLFHSPVAILTAELPDDIPELFRAADEQRLMGKWIAGYVSYECGYHFENVISPYRRRSVEPLIVFYVYDAPLAVGADILDLQPPQTSLPVGPFRSMIGRSEYEKNIARIKEYIRNGDTYQVNYTDRVEFSVAGDEVELYFLLRERQHVPFSAFMNLGQTKILSFSPELFFRVTGGMITVQPMKGTVRRGNSTEEDAALIRWLQQDEKNRSENLMIVDLLRNDIGRICETGSVAVQQMFHVEKYETVLQMTSTITGTVKQGLPYYDIFKALFPCGSVTGAPKIRTMQIIRELEQHDRGIYCGAIGFITPEGDSVFNVAIRTIECSAGIGQMGIGSGIVFDSDAAAEYEECLLKAKFLHTTHPHFQLLETMAWENGFAFLEEHLDRLRGSAEYFSFSLDMNDVRDALRAAEQKFSPQNKYRVRLRVGRTTKPDLEASVLSSDEATPVVAIAPERTSSSDLYLFHKTTNREVYDRYFKKSNDMNIADFVFLNEKEEITEGSYNSIYIESNGHLFTPPVSCGLLPGIYRNHVLTTNPSASEKVLTIDHLRSADAIYLCNSVRGWRKVSLSE